MVALAINGSHRKGRNTAILLKAILDELNIAGVSTEMIELVDCNIKHCAACNKCLSKNECSIQDDDMLFIAEKMLEADVIIIGSPVYNGNVTSMLKTLMDRTRWMHMKEDMLAGKLGAIATVAGLRNGGQEFAYEAIARFLKSRHIRVISVRDPKGSVINMGVMGTLFEEIYEENKSIKIRWRKSVSEDHLAMTSCRLLAANILKELKAL